MTDRMTVGKVMRTLISHFDHVIMAIQEASNKATLKLKDLVGSLGFLGLSIVGGRGVQETIQDLQAQLRRVMLVLARLEENSTKVIASRSLGLTLKR